MDTLHNTESPLFLNSNGLSREEMIAEADRLHSELRAIRQKIRQARTAKERAGADVIRCKQAGKNCSDSEYQLNNLIGEYYKFQGLEKEVMSQIEVLEKSGLNDTLAEPVVYSNAEGTEPDIKVETNQITLFGKTLTYKELAGVAIGILAVSFALAFPIKSTQQIIEGE